MIRFLVAGLLTGLLFAILDGLINGNPFAVKLMEWSKPVARQSVNVPAGIMIDLVYGFVISGIFLLISPSLPTDSAVVRGLAYGLGIWFFRVVMGAVSNWMMFEIPLRTMLYMITAGLIEMLLLGILNGLILKR